ncbi:hypothetical protein IW262DRAFT_741144 [Armillaria fumosa]|nr:hypothetical protein IW262DRAFT_741144 [Armillaria fumosa]
MLSGKSCDARKLMLLHASRLVARRSPPLARGISTLYSELTERGFISQATRPQQLSHALETASQTVYSGIDPTGSALHIGHLFPMMCLLHFELRNHHTIPLIGGATGLVGDPSGRLTERSPADVRLVHENVLALSRGVTRFFRGAFEYAGNRLQGAFRPARDEVHVKSNLEWYQNFGILEFLQRVGVNARVNTMLTRESVRARLESHQGMSFTEFTYQLLQAYDFYYLHKHYGCTIQVGGSDQWGNIVAGVELIGRLSPPSDTVPEPFGVTTPLLTTASGEKFGKSAGNAVWLDPTLTSIFDFYQYFIKVEDADVEKYLKLFTLLSLPDIHDIVETHKLQPEKRSAQRRLAAEVTELVHNRESLTKAETMSKILFREASVHAQAIDVRTLINAFEGDPRLIWCDQDELQSTPVLKLASRHGLVSSNSAARQLIQSRGLYFNDQVVPEIHFTVTPEHLIEGRILILRAGKDKIIVLASK